MGRKAIVLTKDELISKLKDYIENFGKGENNWTLDSYRLRKDYKMLDKDLKKILFDMENLEISDCEFFDINTKELVGFHTLPNGLTYLGVISGGDWEYPLFFIIYFDGSTLRGYIPEEGNVFNKSFKAAYGSECDIESPRDEFKVSDKNSIRKTFSHIDNVELETTLNLDMEEALEVIFGWADDLNYNSILVNKDITDRIEVL